MILKLSDLQRSLDQSLATTHGQSRIFIIVARYCAKAGTSLLPLSRLEQKLTSSMGRRLSILPNGLLDPRYFIPVIHQRHRRMVELRILDNDFESSRDGNGQ